MLRHDSGGREIVVYGSIKELGGGLGEFFSFSLCRPSRIKELDLIVTPW